MAVVHIAVVGSVQGVGFRWYVREHARRVNVAGWVRNNSDGSVELAVAGDDQAVSQLLALVRRGPSGAVVEDVRSLAAVPESELPRPFNIIR